MFFNINYNYIILLILMIIFIICVIYINGNELYVNKTLFDNDCLIDLTTSFDYTGCTK